MSILTVFESLLTFINSKNFWQLFEEFKSDIQEQGDGIEDALFLGKLQAQFKNTFHYYIMNYLRMTYKQEFEMVELLTYQRTHSNTLFLSRFELLIIDSLLSQDSFQILLNEFVGENSDISKSKTKNEDEEVKQLVNLLSSDWSKLLGNLQTLESSPNLLRIQEKFVGANWGAAQKQQTDLEHQVQMLYQFIFHKTYNLFDSQDEFEVENLGPSQATIEVQSNSIFFNKASLALRVFEVHEDCVLVKITSMDDQTDFKMYILIYRSTDIYIEAVLSCSEFSKFQGQIKNFMYDKKIYSKFISFQTCQFNDEQYRDNYDRKITASKSIKMNNFGKILLVSKWQKPLCKLFLKSNIRQIINDIRLRKVQQALTEFSENVQLDLNQDQFYCNFEDTDPSRPQDNVVSLSYYLQKELTPEVWFDEATFNEIQIRFNHHMPLSTFDLFVLLNNCVHDGVLNYKIRCRIPDDQELFGGLAKIFENYLNQQALNSNTFFIIKCMILKCDQHFNSFVYSKLLRQQEKQVANDQGCVIILNFIDSIEKALDCQQLIKQLLKPEYFQRIFVSNNACKIYYQVMLFHKQFNTNPSWTDGIQLLFSFIQDHFMTICMDKIKSELALQQLQNTPQDQVIQREIQEQVGMISKYKNGIEIVKFILQNREMVAEAALIQNQFQDNPELMFSEQESFIYQCLANTNNGQGQSFRNNISNLIHTHNMFVLNMITDRYANYIITIYRDFISRDTILMNQLDIQVTANLRDIKSTKFGKIFIDKNQKGRLPAQIEHSQLNSQQHSQTQGLPINHGHGFNINQMHSNYQNSLHQNNQNHHNYHNEQSQPNNNNIQHHNINIMNTINNYGNINFSNHNWNNELQPFNQSFGFNNLNDSHYNDIWNNNLNQNKNTNHNILNYHDSNVNTNANVHFNSNSNFNVNVNVNPNDMGARQNAKQKTNKGNKTKQLNNLNDRKTENYNHINKQNDQPNSNYNYYNLNNNFQNQQDPQLKISNHIKQNGNHSKNDEDNKNFNNNKQIGNSNSQNFTKWVKNSSKNLVPNIDQEINNNNTNQQQGNEWN